jgi:MoxR-like ATPase
MLKASRARALIHGRNYVIPADLYSLAEDVILHRIRLNYEALADGLTGSSVLESMLHDMGAEDQVVQAIPV